MASPAFVSAAGNVAASGAGVTITRPASVQENDVLVAALTGFDSTTVTFGTPAGWSLYRGPDRRTAGNTIFCYLFYRIVGPIGSEPASYTFTQSSAGYKWGLIGAYRGVDLAQPFDGAGTGNNGSGTTTTYTGITTTGPDRRIILAASCYSSQHNSVPSGFTRRANQPGADLAACLYDAEQASAGATGNKTNTTAATTTWVAQLAALRPAPAASPRFHAQIIG